jgi:hypothetical protein
MGFRLDIQNKFTYTQNPQKAIDYHIFLQQFLKKTAQIYREYPVDPGEVIESPSNGPNVKGIVDTLLMKKGGCGCKRQLIGSNRYNHKEVI